MWHANRRTLLRRPNAPIMAAMNERALDAVLAALTDPDATAAVVDRGGVARIVQGHPWVYRSDVLRLPDRPGFYPVESKKGRTLGWAAVNARSLISVRLVHRGDAPVDRDRLLAALDRARAVRVPAELQATDAYRLVHAEADGLPGLVIDRYGEVAVLKSGCAAFEPHLDAIAQHVADALGLRGVLGRLDDPHRTTEGLERHVRVLYGHVPDEVACRVHGLAWIVAPYEGQKTGSFLDQRENHARLARHARGRGLDVFSYQGGFGLHLARGAEWVELVDASAAALAVARRNAERNDLVNVSFTTADAFARLRELEGAGARFDVISLDPPAFAKRSRDVEPAYGAYKELNLRCMKLLAPGGVLGTSSCSFHISPEIFDRILQDSATDARRTMRVLGRHGASFDHPERLGFPESRYLEFVMLADVPG